MALGVCGPFIRIRLRAPESGIQIVSMDSGILIFRTSRYPIPKEFRSHHVENNAQFYPLTDFED